MPRSRLGTVPRLVAAPCVTSDKIGYVASGAAAGAARGQAAPRPYPGMPFPARKMAIAVNVEADGITSS
jgi:hypothetical protein